MSFIVKLGLVSFILLLFVSWDFYSFDYKKRENQLRVITLKTYINPSFNFKSNDYKEFVYVK